FFFAAGDVEEAVGVLAADVAGGEPAVVDHVAGGLFVFVITGHHVRAAGEDFAVVGDLYLDSRNGTATGAPAGVLGRGETDDGGRFGKAVALEEHHTLRVEIIVQIIGQGGTAGTAALDRAAELGEERTGGVLFAFRAELAIDLVVEVRHSVNARGVNGLA